VHTRANHEKSVEQRLKLKFLPTFLPVHRCRHRWKNGVNADLELPLFPGYLFARASAYERVSIVQLPGVVGLAASSSHPTRIPDEEIDFLRTAIGELSAVPHPYLNTGEKVRIVAGPLAGMEGILTRRKQPLRVVITIELIMRSLVVEVSECDLEPVLPLRTA
jgi:transcription antitermination factor NusG